MKNVIGLALVGMLSLVLAAPVHAAGGHGSGFQSGRSGMHGAGLRYHGSFQHKGHLHGGGCWGSAFVG